MLKDPKNYYGRTIIGTRWCFQQKYCQKDLEENPRIVKNKRCRKGMNKAADVCFSVVFSDETRVKLNTDGIVESFRKKKHTTSHKI